MDKTEDRHTEPMMIVFPLRMEADHMKEISKLAKKETRTRAAIIRMAIGEYLRRKGA